MARNPKYSVEDRAAKIKARTEEAVAAFLRMIETGEFPATVGKLTMLSRASDAPSARWSAGNQALMLAAGTMDARGFRQWEEVGRRVKKGARAFYIFAPRTVKRTEIDEETGEEVERYVLVGFTATPVFRVEDTEGEPLPAYDPPKLPPLIEVAQAFGVSVTYAPQAGAWGGYYVPEREEIVLCTHAERVFFHELAHAAHDRILRQQGSMLAGGQDARQEIVAETAAAALCHIYGYRGYEVQSARYIEHYAGTSGSPEKTLRELMKYAGEVKAVLELILETADQLMPAGAAA